MKSVTFSHIKRAKLEAKRLAKRTPGSALGRCRDTVSRELFGVRDYNELLAHRKATIERSVEIVDGAAHCRFCGMTFCPDLKEDRSEHQRRHDLFEEATEALQYVPLQHAEREALKKAGYTLLESGDLVQQTKGLLMVIRGWFDRSLDAAIDGAYWKQHPNLDTYVSYVIGDVDHLPVGPVTALTVAYGRVDGVIPKGRSYWYPPKN